MYICIIYIIHAYTQNVADIYSLHMGDDIVVLASRRQSQVFFASDHGCPDAACSFCHLTHPLPPKQRPQKLLRDEFRAAVEAVFRQHQDGHRSPAPKGLQMLWFMFQGKFRKWRCPKIPKFYIVLPYRHW